MKMAIVAHLPFILSMATGCSYAPGVGREGPLITSLFVHNSAFGRYQVSPIWGVAGDVVGRLGFAPRRQYGILVTDIGV